MYQQIQMVSLDTFMAKYIMMNLKNIQLMPEKNLLAPFTNALRKFILDEIDKVAEAHQERKKLKFKKNKKRI